jgi:serine/threonine protein phosphatase PrpC
MLDGGWLAAGWDVADVEPDSSSTRVQPPWDPSALVFTSAGLTDRGPVRAINQDAFCERADRGLWAVADGMGGLSDGELASRMVCDALVDAPIVTGLDEQIDVVTDQLRQVNDYLRRAAARMAKPVHSGTTIVVLLIRQQECAVLWAGDSRAYRLRDGLVSQMTTDHVLAGPAGLAAENAEAITRAVGAEDSLVLDVVRSDVRLNDRFMLCSDGVGRSLDAGVLGRILETGHAGPQCAELIAQSIACGSTDNVTAVIVDCTASPRIVPEGSGAHGGPSL